MKLPSKIKIGSHTFDIYERTQYEDSGLETAQAYTYTHGNFIVIAKDLKPALKRRYLMHELLHALIFIFGETDKPDKDERTDTNENLEHSFIYTIQEPMVMLLRDNPKLVEYLTFND